MTKINMLVLKRENSVRTKADFDKEAVVLNKISNDYKNSVIVRFDMVDNIIAEYANDNIFGKALNKLYHSMDKQTHNYAKDGRSAFNLLGSLSTFYAYADNAKEMSDKLDKVIEPVIKTAELLSFIPFEFESFKKVLTSLVTNFAVCHIDKKDTVVEGKLDTRGIPDITFVVCADKTNKDSDIEYLKSLINTVLLSENFLSKKRIEDTINIKGFEKEVNTFCDKDDSIYNIVEIDLTKKDTASLAMQKEVEPFIKDVKTQNVSLLRLMYVLNGLTKMKKEDVFKGKKAQEKLSEIASLNDLVKLFCKT